MFDWSEIGCRSYRAKMEAYVSGTGLRPEADPELGAHLLECAQCREALDDALLAGGLLREADTPSVQPSGAFVTRVMASIREEVSRRSAPETIWKPIELLASRFALVAAVALLVLSIHLAEVASPRPAVAPTPVASRADAVALMPEPPAQPSNPDEVMMALVERGQ